MSVRSLALAGSSALVLSLALMGCSRGPWVYPNRNAQLPPNPKAVPLTVADCSERNARGVDAKDVRTVLQSSYDARTKVPAAPLSENLCQALDGEMFSEFDMHSDDPAVWKVRPSARKRFQERLERTGADYVLIPVVQAEAQCNERRTTIQDSAGRTAGSIGTGRVDCGYSGMTTVALYLMDKSATVVWRAVDRVSTDHGGKYEARLAMLVATIPAITFVPEAAR